MKLNFLNKRDALVDIIKLKKDNIKVSIKRMLLSLGCTTTLVVSFFTFFSTWPSFIIAIICILSIASSISLIFSLIALVGELFNPFFVENKTLLALFTNKISLLEDLKDVKKEFHYSEYSRIKEIYNFLISFKLQLIQNQIEEVENFKKIQSLIQFNELATKEKYIPSDIKKQIEDNHILIYKKMTELLQEVCKNLNLMEKMEDDFNVEKALFEGLKEVKTSAQFLQEIHKQMKPQIKEELIKHTKSLAL